jgi:hypothetical protein
METGNEMGRKITNKKRTRYVNFLFFSVSINLYVRVNIFVLFIYNIIYEKSESE